MTRVVIAGGSLAGLSVARALRQGAFAGPITVVEPETELPPDRPPLSKHVLTGEWPMERAAQPMAKALDSLNLDLRLGHRCVGFDADSRRLTTTSAAGDDELTADHLVVATGSAVRPMPTEWGAPAGVHTIRSRADTAALLADVDATTGPVAVIGAGFIGLEAAASLVSRGHHVTVVEAAPAPLGRVLPAVVGRRVVAEHEGHGVTLHIGAGVDGFEGGDRLTAVRLVDGTTIPAEVAIVGIGVLPAVHWLAPSGLAIDNGLVCDETCQAAPGVWGVGDAANWFNPRYDQRMRVEQWDNAVEMGGYVGRRIAGADEGPYAPVPYFWTDQYDVKLQLVGLAGPNDEFRVIDGDLDGDKWVVAFRRGDQVGGIAGWNRPGPTIRWRMKLAAPEGVAWSDLD